MSWFESLVLGAIQGVTEFLPVSSDGHLNLATNLFAWSRGVPVDGAKALFFDVMLHVGTTLAILLRHRKIGWQGARGLLGATDVADGYRRGPVVRVCLLAVAGTAPLAIDLVLKKKIEAMFEGLWPTAIGFLISAAMLALAARLDRRDLGRKGPAETRYLDAVLIGLAQSLAPLPGVSRSGLTVAAALALGLNRVWAVQFSLLLAIPAIGGATLLELRKVDRSFLTADQITQTVAASALAGVVGYAAIVWLARVVRSGKLWYFSVYLVLLAATIAAGLIVFRGGDDIGGRPAALDGPARGGPGGEGPRADAGRGRRALDRPVRVGGASGHRPAGPADGRPPARLDLGPALAGDPGREPRGARDPLDDGRPGGARRGGRRG